MESATHGSSCSKEKELDGTHPSESEQLTGELVPGQIKRL